MGGVCGGGHAVAMAAPSAEGLPELAAAMRNTGFTEAQVARVRNGGIVTRILPQREDNAAFVTGVARVGASPEAVADGIRRIEVSRSGSRMLQIGRFGTPPRLADVEPLIIDARDLDGLRGCKVGACDVKLGRHAMDAFRAIDWGSVDAQARATQVMKRLLVEQVKTYAEQGASAMAVYDDNERPESVAVAFHQIMRDSPGLVRANPEFYRYFIQFPKRAPPSAVENVFYWSKQRLREPVVSVVHMCLRRVDEGGATGYLVALKHLYDSHYFLAYGEFLTLLPSSDAHGTYLIRSIRALIDPPGGWLRGLLLGRIKSAMRDELARDLARSRRGFESSPRP